MDDALAAAIKQARKTLAQFDRRDTRYRKPGDDSYYLGSMVREFRALLAAVDATDERGDQR